VKQMELKEFIQIFKKNIKTFLFVVLMILGAGMVFQLTKPVSYKTSLTINVTRTGTQETQDYKYDSFYRLQADERFADTVIRWLGSPRIATDIYDDAGMDTDRLNEKQLSRIFRAQRLSSQVINVSYINRDSSSGKKLSESIVKILNRETEELNKTQKEEAWFKIIANKPLIKKTGLELVKTSLIFLALGIFIGIWTVFIKHYWE